MGLEVNATPWPLYPRERPGIRCIECWVGYGWRKPRPHGIRYPDRPVRSQTDYANPAHLRTFNVKLLWDSNKISFFAINNVRKYTTTTTTITTTTTAMKKWNLAQSLDQIQLNPETAQPSLKSTNACEEKFPIMQYFHLSTPSIYRHESLRRNSGAI